MLLKKIGNTSFYSYKNEDSGFVANLFENKKNGELVIAYRGTERIGLGENSSDLSALTKDVQTDFSLIMCTQDVQFELAYEFYKLVTIQNPNKKIILLGQSLGGALAQITAAKIYCTTKQKVKSYTYNAPGCKHLLDIYGCDSSNSYPFITNYAVMNDWCGMFGEHIGETYLLPPIPLIETNTDSYVDILNNILLTSHEGIFEYTGKVIKKPDNFNQNEGLALWLFDTNNPIKEFGSITDIIKSTFTQYNFWLSDAEDKNLAFIQNNNMFNFQEFAKQLQTVTTNFLNEQKEKLIETLNNNTVGQVSQFLDKTFSAVTADSLKTALKVLKKNNIHRKEAKYYNSFL